MTSTARHAPAVKQKKQMRVNILRERLPQIPPAKLNAAQKKVAADITAGPRKDVRGPFVPMMRSPGLTGPTQALGAYIRWGVKVPFRLAEFAGLMAARDWSCQYEWAVHVPHHSSQHYNLSTALRQPVAGALGVAHMLRLLIEELEACMALAGCATIDEIGPHALVPADWPGD